MSRFTHILGAHADHTVDLSFYPGRPRRFDDSIYLQPADWVGLPTSRVDFTFLADLQPSGGPRPPARLDSPSTFQAHHGDCRRDLPFWAGPMLIQWLGLPPTGPRKVEVTPQGTFRPRTRLDRQISTPGARKTLFFIDNILKYTVNEKLGMFGYVFDWNSNQIN